MQLNNILQRAPELSYPATDIFGHASGSHSARWPYMNAFSLLLSIRSTNMHRACVGQRVVTRPPAMLRPRGAVIIMLAALAHAAVHIKGDQTVGRQERGHPAARCARSATRRYQPALVGSNRVRAQDTGSSDAPTIVYEMPGWKTAQDEEDLAQLFRYAQSSEMTSQSLRKPQSPLLYLHVHGTDATAEQYVPAFRAPFKYANQFLRRTELCWAVPSLWKHGVELPTRHPSLPLYSWAMAFRSANMFQSVRPHIGRTYYPTSACARPPSRTGLP